MRYQALACDYDGTLAHHGVVDDSVIAALRRCQKSGRRVLLVTGREVADLSRVFGHLNLFDCVVAENGATLYLPATGEEKALVPPPPAEFAAALKSRGVGPISVGRVIVATWTPHETTVLETIRDLGLELQVIFNKGAVMVLPSGVNKASGLSAALDYLGLSPHNTVAIGDAENDHALLHFAEAGVAVANAVPMLLERADFVTAGDHGAGVIELVDRLLETDFREIEPRLTRHDLLIGSDENGREIRLIPYRTTVWVAAPSTTAIEQATTPVQNALAAVGRQFCVIAPRGLTCPPTNAVVVGSSAHVPELAALGELIGEPRRNVVADLSAVSSNDCPTYIANIYDLLQEERRKSGRPHWLLLHDAPRLGRLPKHFARDNLAFDGLVVATTVESADARQHLLRAFNINAVIQAGTCSPEDWNLLRSALPLEIPPLSATQGASHAIFWSQAAGEPRGIVFTAKSPAPVQATAAAQSKPAPA